VKKESTIVSLVPFEERDFPFLRSEVESSRFILQWAGPKYTFPLTWEQLDLRIRKTAEGEKSIYMFKVMERVSGETIGFIELSIRDHVLKVGNVESVLVFRKYRGKGYGKQLMSAIVGFAFQNLHMNELTLSVFDFNVSAKACYQHIGFEVYEVGPAPLEFENEKWSFVRMKLTKDQWYQSLDHSLSADSSSQSGIPTRSTR
jgi:RimJ/RimL family protein N-acetyltransferase